MDNNSTYEQYEQEIDLKDLMFAVLHKWRPVILVAVVLAVLLGGAKGAMTYRQQNDPEVSKEKNTRRSWISTRRIKRQRSVRSRI